LRALSCLRALCQICGIAPKRPLCHMRGLCSGTFLLCWQVRQTKKFAMPPEGPWEDWVFETHDEHSRLKALGTLFGLASVTRYNTSILQVSSVGRVRHDFEKPSLPRAVLAGFRAVLHTTLVNRARKR
jgi:hypothetical protein